MKIKLITISLVLTIGISYYFYSSKSNLNSKPLKGEQFTDLKAPLEDKKIPLKKRVSIKETRYETKHKNSTYSSSFPAGCENSFLDLSKMPSQEYIQILISKENFDSHFSKGCRESLKKNKLFTELAKNSNSNILDKNFKFEESNIYGSCTTLLFTLKAYSIADHTKGLPFDKMTSQELAANFVKMFFSIDSLTKDALLENMKLLDTFYELHSDDPSVVEAYLGYIMIAQQVTNQTISNDKINSIWANSMGDSFKIDRLSVLKDVIKKDMGSAKSTLDKLNSYYKNEPELQYYYAAYYWKKGNRDMANNYLDRAIKMSDKCSYCVPSLYKDTKSKMKSAKIGDDKLFSISIGLNFEVL